MKSVDEISELAMQAQEGNNQSLHDAVDALNEVFRAKYQRKIIWNGEQLVTREEPIEYIELADAIEEHRIRRCKECGRAFVVSKYARGRMQVFCPPEKGKKESICGIRSRQRVYRQKKHEERIANEHS